MPCFTTGEKNAVAVTILTRLKQRRRPFLRRTAEGGERLASKGAMRDPELQFIVG